jgi:hypothetical protein
MGGVDHVKMGLNNADLLRCSGRAKICTAAEE